MTPSRRTLNQLRATVLEAMRPVERRPLSEWIEDNLYLPSGLSAVPGKIRLWNFQKGIADAMCSGEYERVSVLKGARPGYSSLLVAAISYHIKVDPTSVLVVVPTIDDVGSFVKTQLEPVLEASPALHSALGDVQRGAQIGFGNRDTLAFRRFTGGSLRVISSRSPRALRSHSARIIIIDEADAMEMTEEGSPILLAEKRSLSFDNRTIIMGSSPTTTLTSYVADAYENGDKRVYEVCCPSCGEFSEIMWKDIIWPENQPEAAEWCCPSCGTLHGEQYKFPMVEAGRWRATAPHVKNHASFRLNCLIAPHGPAAWGKLAAEFSQARKSVENLKTFVCTVLGQPWTDDSDDAPAPHELQLLAEPISLDAIPAETLFLTCGVDLQIDRAEVLSLGFTSDDTWLFLDHRVIYGDPQKDEIWRDLDELLSERYPHPAGGTIGRDAICIDAGDGHVYQRVMNYAAGRRHMRVVPVKGAAGSRPPLVHAALKRSRNLHICGVDGLKTRLFDRLARRQGIRFSDALPGAWYEQLLSERAVVRYSRGQPHRIWERYPGKLAEALDCAVYGIAARSLIATSAPRREAELAGITPPPPMPTTIRSAWLDQR